MYQIDVLYLVPSMRILLDGGKVATITRCTTERGRHAIIHTDLGDCTVALPCTARLVRR